MTTPHSKKSPSLGNGAVSVIRMAGAACLAALATAGATTVVRQRRRIVELDKQLAVRDAELEHLRANRLPALAESILTTGEVRVPGPLAASEPGSDHDESVESLISRVEEIVQAARDHVEQTSRRTLTGVLDTVRGLAAEQHMAVSEMQHRHDDGDVLADLYTIDHAGSQLSRRLRGFSVLFGAWIGQQRSATVLRDILRGAQSQIRDYQRVSVGTHNAGTHTSGAGSPVSDDLGVVTRVVEPLVLIVAELLDNATRYSPPYAQVSVGIQPAHHGVAITVDDAGVGMPVEEQRRAERLLGNRTVALEEIGDPPRVGFAVIGLLAARYGFTVSVDAPPLYGGVRAVVFVPNELLTRVEQDAVEPAESESPRSEGSSARARTSGGLPKRSRRTRTAVAEPVDPQVPSDSNSAADLAAWQRATDATQSERGAESEDEDSHA